MALGKYVIKYRTGGAPDRVYEYKKSETEE